MLQLLGPLASVLSLGAGSLVDRAKRAGVAWAVIGLFALVALVFSLVAIHTALIYWIGPIWSPVLIAGVAALVALSIYVAWRFGAAQEHRREAERQRSTETTALVTTAAIAALPALLKSPLVRTVGIPLGGALAALFILSRSRPADREK